MFEKHWSATLYETPSPEDTAKLHAAPENWTRGNET